MHKLNELRQSICTPLNLFEHRPCRTLALQLRHLGHSANKNNCDKYNMSLFVPPVDLEECASALTERVDLDELMVSGIQRVIALCCYTIQSEIVTQVVRRYKRTKAALPFPRLPLNIAMMDHVG